MFDVGDGEEREVNKKNEDIESVGLTVDFV